MVTVAELYLGVQVALYGVKRVMGLEPSAGGDDAFLTDVGVRPLSNSAQGEDVKSVMEYVTNPSLVLQILSFVFSKFSVLFASNNEKQPLQNDAGHAGFTLR